MVEDWSRGSEGETTPVGIGSIKSFQSASKCKSGKVIPSTKTKDVQPSRSKCGDNKGSRMEVSVNDTQTRINLNLGEEGDVGNSKMERMVDGLRKEGTTVEDGFKTPESTKTTCIMGIRGDFDTSKVEVQGRNQECSLWG